MSFQVNDSNRTGLPILDLHSTDHVRISIEDGPENDEGSPIAQANAKVAENVGKAF
jgi:hypothetical protein